MSLHVVRLTSLWLFAPICVSELRIYFNKRGVVNQRPSKADGLHFMEALLVGFRGSRGSVFGWWGGDPPTVFSFWGIAEVLSSA